jgi:hypothetical protein
MRWKRAAKVSPHRPEQYGHQPNGPRHARTDPQVDHDQRRPHALRHQRDDECGNGGSYDCRDSPTDSNQGLPVHLRYGYYGAFFEEPPSSNG